jgi:hypothetical protein
MCIVTNPHCVYLCPQGIRTICGLLHTDCGAPTVKGATEQSATSILLSWGGEFFLRIGCISFTDLYPINFAK